MSTPPATPPAAPRPAEPPAGAPAVPPGAALPARTYQVTRADLVRYAGASGDFNPIHWSDRVATRVGLPGVIAHGMYTMALAGRALADWAGDPAAVLDYAVRFTRPVVVPDDDTGAEVTVCGKVRECTDDGSAWIDLTVTSGGEKVLGQARALLRALAPTTAPTTVPSAAPMTVPSAAPMTVPSAAPMTVPSAAPTTRRRYR